MKKKLLIISHAYLRDDVYQSLLFLKKKFNLLCLVPKNFEFFKFKRDKKLLKEIHTFYFNKIFFFKQNLSIIKRFDPNWIIVELFAVLNRKNLSISKSPISAKNLSSLINMITTGKISGKIAKDVFDKMQVGDKDPKEIVENEGLKQQSDPKELEKIIVTILSKNHDKVGQYKSGKEKLFGYFVGEVMKITKGKANPQLVNQILKSKLK